MTAIVITPMLPNDWIAVSAIYAEGISTGNATFETDLPDWERWNASHLPSPRLVARCGSEVVGWAALSRVSARAVYAGVAEVSVYVASAARGQKIGLRLLEELIQHAEQNGFWTLQASIFPENTASLRLHERCGFRFVGCRERIAQLNGQWRDTLLLERRSASP